MTPPPMETHKKVKANQKKAKDTKTQGFVVEQLLGEVVLLLF